MLASSNRSQSMSIRSPRHILRVLSQMLLFLSFTTTGVRAWLHVSSRRAPLPHAPPQRDMAAQPLGLWHRSARYSSRNPDSQDEEESCMGGSNDEEECEIDWSKMPGFAEDDDDDNVDNTLRNSGSEDEDFDELRLALERQFQLTQDTNSIVADNAAISSSSLPIAKPSSLPSPSKSSMQSDWQRLEMMWQQREAATECDVYEPVTCGGHVCPTCSGSGTSICRFCRGTKFLYLPITHDHADSGDEPLPPSAAQQQPFVSCSVCHASGAETCRSCQGSGWIADWTQMGVRAGGRNAVPPPSAWLE